MIGGRAPDSRIYRRQCRARLRGGPLKLTARKTAAACVPAGWTHRSVSPSGRASAGSFWTAGRFPSQIVAAIPDSLPTSAGVYKPRMNTKTVVLVWVFSAVFSLLVLFHNPAWRMPMRIAKRRWSLLQLVTPKETYNAMIEQMTKQMPSMAQNGARFHPTPKARWAKRWSRRFPYEDLANWTVDVYSTKFTTDKIKQLISFYKTPSAKKRRS